MIGIVAEHPEQSRRWAAELHGQPWTPMGLGDGATDASVLLIVDCGYHTSPLTLAAWLRSQPVPIILITPHVRVGEQTVLHAPNIRLIVHPAEAVRELPALVIMAQQITSGAGILALDCAQSWRSAHG